MKRNLILTVLTVFLIALVNPAFAAAKKKKGGAGKGEKITAVDDKSLTTTKGTYEIASDTVIKVDGKESTAADLKEGMRVKIIKNEDKISEIDAMTGAGKKKPADAPPADAGADAGGGGGGGE